MEAPISPAEPTTSHPVGWPFIGAGAAAWLLPLFGSARVAGIAWGNPAVLVLAIFVVSFAGLVFEFLFVRVERLLLRLSGLGAAESDPDVWAAAWRARWRFQAADAELRRYEGGASFARAYLVHACLATVVWAAKFASQGSFVSSLLTVGAGALAVLLFYSMWKFNTAKVIIVVRSASKWTSEGKLA